MFSESENKLSIVPALDDVFKTDPFLRYNLGNGDLIKMVEKTGAAGIFIRTREIQESGSFEPNGSVLLPDYESSLDQSGSQMSVDSSETSEMNVSDIEQSASAEIAESEIGSQNSKTKWSPMFISTPDYNRLFLFKNISRKTAKIAEELSNSLANQFLDLSEIKEKPNSAESCEIEQKIPVTVILLMHKSFEDIVPDVEDTFKAKIMNFDLLKFDVQFSIINTDKKISGFQNNSQKEKLAKLLSSEENDDTSLQISDFLKKMVAKMSEEKIKLSERLIKAPGSGVCALGEPDRMIEIFRSYFGGKDVNLITVPDFDRSMSNLLYSTNEDGMRENNEAHVGEMRKYSKQLLAVLEKPAGILLKSYTLNHIKSLLDISNYFNFTFEIDWLLCGAEYVVAFEVSVANQTENYETAITNKLMQVLQKTVPKTLFFLCTILNGVASNLGDARVENQQIIDTIQSFFKIIIYIPNADLESIENALSCAKKRAEQKPKGSKLSADNNLLTAINYAEKSGTLNYVQILIHNENSSNSLPVLYTIDNALKLTKSPISIEQIFDCFKFRNESTQINEERKRTVEYLSALFSLSFLMVDNTCHLSRPFDIDSRYQNSDLPKNEKAKLNQVNKTLLGNKLNLIVSPQQHKILKDDDKFCCLPGEPGCGKTSVLLAKALIESANPETDVVIFAVPQSKVAFLKFVRNFFDANLMDQERSKLQIVALEEYSSTSLKEQVEKICKPEDLKRCVLLIDEIYMGQDVATGKYFINRNSLCNIILQCKRCWIAYIDVGTHKVFGSPLSEMIVRHFKIKCMNVLFRSAHHISAFSNNFIHTRKPITGTTALVTGCYTSSQFDIKTNNFDKKQLLAKLDKNWFTLNPKYAGNQMVVIFTLENQKEIWSRFQTEQDKICSFSADCYIVDPNQEFYQLPFAGCEAWSVLIIIDVDCSSFNVLSAINLAVSRAQYEVVLCVNNDYRESLDQFLELKPCSYLSRMETLSTVKIFTRDELQSVPDDHQMELLIGGVVNLERLTGLISFLDSFPEDRKEKFALFIFKTFAHGRRPGLMSFLDKLGEVMGSQIIQSVSVSLEREICPDLQEIERKCITYGNVEKFDWILTLIGDEKAKLWARKSSQWLLFACCNQIRNIIPWVVEKLRKFDLLQEQMSRIYQHEFGYEFFETREIAPVTLLLILCCQNATSDYLECILDSGFPKELLAEKLDGKNAYEWCEIFDNTDNMKLLEATPERREVFGKL